MCCFVGALLSLCLLGQVYDHSCDVISSLSTLPLGAEVLVQIDRLVQLLETPAFTFLRLQLLQPTKFPDLIRAMYGLLMLLPQSSAFKTLHARLHSVPTLALMQLDGQTQGGRGNRQQTSQPPSNWADFDALLKGFCARQQAHATEEERRRAVMEGLHIEEEIKREQQQQAAVAALENGDAAAAPLPEVSAQTLQHGMSDDSGV